MAERNPVSWLNAGAHTAENDRLTEGGVLFGEGVDDSAALKISAPGGMFARVAAGWFAVLGTNSGTQGKYKGYQDANVDKSVAPADGTNPRKDLVIARVIDAAYVGGIINQWQLEVVTGTPAGSPVEPALPANSLKLAVITVTAGAAAVTAGMISDTRKYASAVGGGIAVLSTDTPTKTRPGLRRFNTDKNSQQVRNAADSAWLDMGNIHIAAYANLPTNVVNGAWGFDPTTGITYRYTGSSWAGAPWWQKIADQYLVADGAITFSSLPTDFRFLDLKLLLRLRNGIATVSDLVYLRFNNDSAANYAYEYVEGASAVVSGTGAAGTGIIFGRVAGNTATAGRFGAAEVVIPYYAEAISHQAHGHGSYAQTGTFFSANGGGMWATAAAINRIDVLGASATWKVGSRAILLACG